ncbi:MAG TPA: neuromedin U [Terriglobales bacterium]
MRSLQRLVAGVSVLLWLAAVLPACAQEQPVAPEGTQVGTEETQSAATNSDALRKAAQNPVASLISVPFQNNTNFNIGDFERVQDVLNIQPVVPFKLSDKWNLITRTILPIIWQPYPSDPTGGEYGLGDLNPSVFLSPGKPGKLIWGAGPALVIPTATNTVLGQGKFSIGPSVVLLAQPGHWTLGVLTNNVWSVAGDSSRPNVNQFLLQYFINYNLKKGYYFAWQPIITANWEASGPNRWSVPYGGGVGRIMKLGFQPVNMQLQFFANPTRPPGSASWTMRFQVALLYPKLSKEQQKMLMEEKLKQLQQEQPKE